MKSREDRAEKMNRIDRRLVVGLLLIFACVSLAACNFTVSESTGEVNALLSPIFSREAGFYQDPFSLTLKTNWGREIYYTTDGSDPRTSDTAVIYDKEIPIYNNTSDPNRLSEITDITLEEYHPPKGQVPKGIIIRAAVKSAGGSFGEVVTNSYFVGKNKSYYSDMKVISMVTEERYLFDPDTGAYQVGSGYYEWLNSEEYQHYEPGDVQNPTNYNKEGKESEFPVSIQVFEKGKEVYSENVGARISGNWSRSAAQKSFRLYARKEYGKGKMKYAFFDELKDSNGILIQEFDKVTIRNSGNDSQTVHFRDAFLQDLTQGLATDYMASQPCILFLNGEFWGFYMLREKPDADYIESHYGIPQDNIAVLKNGQVESGDDRDLEAFNEFFAWAQSVDMSQPENYKKFCEGMDLQSFMDYVSVQTYINNADWLNGYVNNWQVWHTRRIDNSLPKADGKWRFIFYDLDYSAGLYYAENTDYVYDSLNCNGANGALYDFLNLLDNLMANPGFASKFRENYLRIVEEVFAPDVVDALLDSYVEDYKVVTRDTFHRFGMGWAADGYEDNVAHMREFFHKRPEYANKYLDKFCEKDRSGPKPMVRPVTQWGYYGNAEFSANEEEKAFYVSVPEVTPESWNIQCQAHGITLTKGEKYRITFKASCTTPGTMSVGINRSDNGEYPTCFWDEVHLTEELQEYSLQFTMEKATNYDWYLNFSFGDIAGDYVIKNVVMEPVE